MQSAHSAELWNRLHDRVAGWRIIVERVTETSGSVVAFGRRDEKPVVLKVIKNSGDEWRSGEILDAFDGRGVVRVYEYGGGAVLAERLTPGRSLVTVALNGADDYATRILAGVIAAMSPRPWVNAVPTVTDWGRSFESYAASGDTRIDPPLLSAARRVYFDLCRSQGPVRLLHGDLHHGNVLFDRERGWVAVDPKGVIGEVEYEVGAALRNPYDAPALFADVPTIRRRVACLVRELGLDAGRVVSWAFGQAVLAVIWTIEDGDPIEPGDRWITLAETLRAMLNDSPGGQLTLRA